jgi:arginine:ornithine antiporter/lysine permease
MVVGSMVGSGIFSLPRTFGIATGPFGAIIAWCIAAGGMHNLARVFQFLAERKPDIDAGAYAYAKAGFGDYPGFLSALGYWIGSCIGKVSYWMLIKSTLGALSVPSAGNFRVLPDYLLNRDQYANVISLR